MRKVALLLLLALCAIGIARAATAGSTEEKHLSLSAASNPPWNIMAEPCAVRWRQPTEPGVCRANEPASSTTALSFRGQQLEIWWCSRCFTQAMPEHLRGVKLCSASCSSELYGKLIGLSGLDGIFAVAGGRVDGKTVLPDNHIASHVGVPGGPMRLTVGSSGRATIVLSGYIKLGD